MKKKYSIYVIWFEKQIRRLPKNCQKEQMVWVTLLHEMLRIWIFIFKRRKISIPCEADHDLPYISKTVWSWDWHWIDAESPRGLVKLRP